MEKHSICGMNTLGYTYSELQRVSLDPTILYPTIKGNDKLFKAILPKCARLAADDIHENHKLEMHTNAESATFVYMSFSLGSLVNVDVEFIAVDDSNPENLKDKSIIPHELTHFYIERKCKPMSEEESEGVAYARGRILSGDSFDDRHDISIYLHRSKYPNGIDMDSYFAYLNAATKIGDEASLQLMRIAANTKTGKFSDNLNQNVEEYKQNFKRLFGDEENVSVKSPTSYIEDSEEIINRLKYPSGVMSKIYENPLARATTKEAIPGKVYSAITSIESPYLRRMLSEIYGKPQ